MFECIINNNERQANMFECIINNNINISLYALRGKPEYRY